jgi:putative phosphoesterase
MKDAVVAADAVIHAGDYATDACRNSFIANAKAFYGVRGNNDFFSIPSELNITLGGLRIAVTHGHQAYGYSRESWLVEHFAEFAPDIIIFGHTHRAFLGKVDGVILLNPGSVTQRRGAPHHTMAEFNTDEPAQVQIINID